MSKIAQYLNEHTVGEVTGSQAVRSQLAHDASVLEIKPEFVMFPRVTSDIRKAARFAWQLAEKGHKLGLTARGGGNDITGAAIGAGLLIDLSRHMNSILYVGHEKERFVHVQPGVPIKALGDALAWRGMAVEGAIDSPSSTVGGALSRDVSGEYKGRYGRISKVVSRLEVVLANGDVIETGRIGKRELSRKKGLQTFEGEIYRQLDALIDDNSELIGRISASAVHDAIGYKINNVKKRDGSFDLTPLFVGAQGTLGIISEAVLKTAFFNQRPAAIVATVASMQSARDLTDILNKLEPTALDIVDGELYEIARAAGKKYVINAKNDAPSVGAAIYIGFDDSSDRIRDRKRKKALKILKAKGATSYTSSDFTPEELDAIRDAWSTVSVSTEGSHTIPALIDSAIVPRQRHEEFESSLAQLAEKYRVKLPLHIRVIDESIVTRPSFDLSKVGDKQKVFKLLSEYAALVVRSGGAPYGTHAEGRLGAFAAYEQYEGDEIELYEKIRAIFDPYGTLNPGVKQKQEIKTLVSHLKS